MTKKAKFSTITAIVAAIAIMSTIGIIGGAGQHVASATVMDLDDLNNLVRQGIVDDEDSGGTDDSIIIWPDITFATDVVDDIVDDVVDDEDSGGTDDSIIILPDVAWITPEISSRIPDVSSIVINPDINI